MKKYSLILLCLIHFASAQIIFQDKFNNLTLSTYTTLYTTTLYTTIPSGYLQFNDGFPNTTGSSLHPNAPFHTDSLKYKGWGILYHKELKDTFLVSTSWIDSNRAISRWILLPPVSGISVNSVLHWKAMAPDANHADGYAVYISTNTTTNDTTIFNNSNKVFQINDNNTSGGGEKQQWIQRSVSLANYSGQNIRIAFKNISRQKYQLWIDDITIENLPYAIDASIENVGNPKYLLVNQPFNLSARIKNNGYQPISNLQLTYSIQGIAYNNQSFSLNSNLLPLTTTTLAFTNTISINTAGMYKVKIWINKINGNPDPNPFNDTTIYYLSVLSTSITPKILIEQITDAGMPDAPANQDTLSYLSQQDTNIIAVQIHQTDSLQCNVSGAYMSNFRVPENQLVALINRNFFVSGTKNYFFKNELRQYINTDKLRITPCRIHISNVNVDTNLRIIQLDVSVQFFQNTHGDYRVGIYLIENNICGNPADTSINGYNQLSSFYFTPYSNYYQMGYYSSIANAFVLNAYQYKHQYVLNQSATSILGDISFIPNTTIPTIYTKTYTISVPNTANNIFRYNFDNLYIVAFVYEHDSLLENRKILNAVKYKVTGSNELVSIPQLSDHSSILVYPNPASDYLHVQTNTSKNFNAEILNIFGQSVLTIQSEVTDISMLSEGIYFVKINIDNKIVTRKLLIKK